MDAFLAHFQTISSIPHCSFHTLGLREHIIACGNEYGYDVRVDKAGNICCYHTQEPKMILQAHYDMVCMGKAPEITLQYQNRFLRAKESSLGADNGMGCAMMLALMQEGAPVDCLFTNDEEVGLIGAANLELSLRGSRLLNLDSEEEGKVYVGCAGGVDLSFSAQMQEHPCRYKRFYEITATSPGGHSGIDISKGINNAIIAIADFLQDKDIELVSFEGGVKNNAIPSFSKAVVAAKGRLEGSEDVTVIPVHRQNARAYTNGHMLLHTIASAPNGVLQYDKKLHTPEDSSNLAVIDHGTINISLRSMTKAGLQRITQRLRRHFAAFECTQSGYYEPWEPVQSVFAQEVRNACGGEFAAIHAGLECAILQQKFPHIQMASIGPDIYYPHSVKEYTDLRSCERIFKLIKTLL